MVYANRSEAKETLQLYVSEIARNVFIRNTNRFELKNLNPLFGRMGTSDCFGIRILPTLGKF